MKKSFIYIITLLFVFVTTACNNKSWQPTKGGIIVQTEQSEGGTQLVRLQVVNDRIIRVSATPDKEFSSAESLITIPDLQYTDAFEVSEDTLYVILTTSALNTKVNKRTGEISFFDTAGNPILQEKVGGGKSFTPIEVEGTKGYTLHQVFESPGDEAFYGLGQHQSDEFNYKGKNESLFQYNTKVSVPFIVSSRNYGILWDNYSLSKWGDPRDYAQLNRFKIYNREGAEGTLTATYKNPKSGQEIVRQEESVNYEDLQLIKNFPEGFPDNGTSVTWEGAIEADQEGIHRFLLRYAGYTSIYLNNEEVVKERWRTAWNPNDYKFTYAMPAGEKVPFRIEWQPDGGESFISLKVLDPVAEQEQEMLSLWSEMGDQIDYYFVAGDNIDQVISGYRTVTGKSQIMPKWAMGFWQSRERYKTQWELLETLAEFRRRNIPIDNIVQDWFYWPVDAWGDHEFDPERFPDPKGMVDSVHALDARIMISVWPKFYITTKNYKAFDEKGWMYQQAVKDSIRDWVYPGYVGSFYDAYSEDARKLFWQQMEDMLVPHGFDAWWMDASEPNVRDNTSMPYRKQLCGPTALGPSTKYFNAYGLMNAEAIYNGQRGVDPNDRVFLLTRSGFAGIQRYSTAVWSGDIGTRWEDMKAQISAGLNFALSGIPYWTMDIGGFCVEKRYEEAQRLFESTGRENNDLKEWRELNVRWHQFGAFAPLFRSHGQFPLREMFHIAPESHPAYQSMLYYNKLRYRLMPYIYTLAGMTWFNDYTIMRALVMDFPHDAKVKDISDQYMFGPALMACPVYEYGARSREVYFPGTEGWYDLHTGRHMAGEVTATVDAPYEHMPLFVRAGSIVPFGPEIMHTKGGEDATLTIYVYAGKDGSFSLYEDDGVSYSYEKGNYSTIPFRYTHAEGTLEIGDRSGSYDGMVNERNFNIVLVDPSRPIAMDGKTTGTIQSYNGSSVTIQLK